MTIGPAVVLMGIALFQPGSAPDHLARAERLFDSASFEEAAEEFRRAYEIDPQAEILLNIGLCYRKLGRHDEARHTYKRFLDKAPPDMLKPRALAEKRIRELDELMAKREPEKAPAPPAAPFTLASPPPSPVPARPIYRRGWFWVVAGTALAGGIVLGLIATQPRGLEVPVTTLGTHDVK